MATNIKKKYILKKAKIYFKISNIYHYKNNFQKFENWF